MTEKYFNQTHSLPEIILYYKNNKFPNAYCLLWNKVNHDGLATEQGKILMCENGKVVETDGITKPTIH